MINHKSRLVIIITSIIILIIYFLSSAGNTAFNHFILLADAFLKGHLYIEGVYPWLEKVPIDINRWYVTNPPMPAIIALPFVLIFGKEFPQQIIAHIFGMGIVGMTMILSYKIKKDIKLAIWSGLLIGLGSIVWFLSSVGSVWYLGQVTSAFFLTWALVEIFGKSRPILLGILLGSVFLSRSHTALVFPFMIFMNWNKFKNIKILTKLILVFSIFAIFGFSYNYLRFGNPFDNGYSLIPDVNTSSWFSSGLWSPTYIPKNFNIFFLKLPVIRDTFPYIVPSLAGMSIILTTPAFIYAFFAAKKDLVTKLSWISILIILFIVASHGGTGFSQFGYRFAVDFYPFLMLLTIKGIVKQNGPRWHNWLLLLICIIVNTWGVLFINKFDWVGW
ncbi:MAG: hypothetical protein UR39_C0003G0036 [Candidatus Woesebacteria bacterium GW2011_GWA1_33_30]|uniref:Glycosyltransferase RgtA/B/C/D-like domain-containing protein n=1 Tax=Candidatus Woesebacteria bacterium GW2011_GWA2_33_28 TaxID=1618561 RepID=A0A0F9ZTP6_9BACT|nr:MAG: hypothetical protein UR38_C0003G0039 [Candidatus Woesebacteria bacterium GW2011_GWA2_33_28]KKP48501.1 MAG: hypothetical protein UR39_C0003G0036 [Candidatus Woesebacteria bacterium GW2011_GWA1_33_30]KKP49640.1 MAG: hypothetical protein UR40_C0004G0039 [Microgenomates group bacterium GW2011_GWC1_33_32]KKP52257.1 MAG: hypothetical protein UR44_C0003G0039 [Candidatus Woesebacteria bacterium GW2011_GWB1_33_38]KKP58091.1 MAG: hypothetical protein UR48_C0008G0024 [Microgenomates group bacteriu